jgi:hypothetical protein
MCRRCLAGIVAALLLLPLAGCQKRESPEQQVRALIARAEAAAEARRAGELRGYLSEQYRDEEGRDKRALEAVIRLTVLRHESIHLLTRISEVSVPQAGRARAVVHVAMAGQPLASVGEIAPLNADLHRFELDFVQENGEWKVVSARWRRAEPADFLQ